MENKEKTCWACKRILVDESKLGLCPDCLNKYGSVAAAFGVAGVTALSGYVVKNGGKILKVVASGIKLIKG